MRGDYAGINWIRGELEAASLWLSVPRREAKLLQYGSSELFTA
jgi:hypothetical protein